MEHGPQAPIAIVTTVHLVAVTEIKPPAVQFHDYRTGMDGSLQRLGENRPQVEVMVPLQTDQPHTVPDEALQPFQNRLVLRIVDAGSTEPEFKQIPEDEDGLNSRGQGIEETEQMPVIGILRAPQMGVGNENGVHAGHYS